MRRCLRCLRRLTDTWLAGLLKWNIVPDVYIIGSIQIIWLFFLGLRFGRVEDQKDALRLYTVQIPHKRDRKPPPCYLTKWEGKSFLPMLTAPCGNEVISSLAVRYLLCSDSLSYIIRDIKNTTL